MTSQRANHIANYFKIASLNIKSNIAGNVFAFAIMSFSFFIMLFFLLCYVNIYNYMNFFRNKNIMLVFLKKNGDKDTVIKFIKNIGGVKNAVYYNDKSSLVSLEKKIRRIKPFLKNENPGYAPSFIKINFKKNDTGRIFLSDVYLRIKSLSGVGSVYYDRMLRKKIGQFIFFTKFVGLVLFIFLFILSIFISYSAIKLIILRKKEEIEILKLIGATNYYIRIPMFIEGQAGTLLAFIISILLLLAIYDIFIFYGFNGFLEYFHIKIVFLNTAQTALVFIIAMISGFLGTYFSSKRFF